MSAIARSTVSTVPSATAFFSSSIVTRDQATRSAPPHSGGRRRGTGASGGRIVAGGVVAVLVERLLDVDLPDLAGEVLVGAHLPPDADDDQHRDHGQRRVVDVDPVE